MTIEHALAFIDAMTSGDYTGDGVFTLRSKGIHAHIAAIFGYRHSIYAETMLAAIGVVKSKKQTTPTEIEQRENIHLFITYLKDVANTIDEALVEREKE